MTRPRAGDAQSLTSQMMMTLPELRESSCAGDSCAGRSVIHDLKGVCFGEQAAKGVKAYDKAEDPIYALEHNLPIDFQHYLDHHLELPLTRLFGPVMNNPKELMTGWDLKFLRQHRA